MCPSYEQRLLVAASRGNVLGTGSGDLRLLTARLFAPQHSHREDGESQEDDSGGGR